MYNQSCSAQLNEAMLLKQCNRLIKIRSNQILQVTVRNIAGGEKPKLLRALLEIECIDKIGIFGNDNAIARIGKQHNIEVFYAVLFR
jgi:hypothetical protein